MRRVVDYIKNEVAHPASSLSNLSYVAFGAMAIHIEPFLGWLLIALGIASTGYHWVNDDCWHKADIVMIYYVFAVIAMWLFFGATGILIGGILGGLAHLSFNRYASHSQKIIGFLGGLCLIAFWIQPEKTIFDVIDMLLWFVLAFACSFVADNITIFKEREKVYDAFHAFWHVFTGAGIYHLII